MQRYQRENRPFKERKSFATRKNETTEIRGKYPNKIPVVVERYRKEKTLPQLDRIKFLVSPDISMSQFLFTLRTRLSLTATQAFYLLVNNQTLPCPSLTLLEVYNDNKDEDGFLYMTYASQEMFGGGASSEHQWNHLKGVGSTPP
ncbi:PREDICTED: microtubule-associated proteins 1A/1B light chain 3C-like [Thamnophis sirtalis]|uniref:Microtubule-associated proteins 1A/1B light chain 3C-like n=1 Tax=Thamnophis sirtalis TaxID=35019 RepID=A0A6I9YTU8_9SAUR|nr:PREDICTED: microtubule-associated proteins 1A/1B light chain 3C-like [Thamnophis sirtalis]XP_013927411.1 PREDICTED: microtubule-associated proteins 1A/1B light chain 3C-like [Thamnophis sirtalis]